MVLTTRKTGTPGQRHGMVTYCKASIPNVFVRPGARVHRVRSYAWSTVRCTFTLTQYFSEVYSPRTVTLYIDTCIKCFGKKDEINEIKNYYKKGAVGLRISIFLKKNTFSRGSLIQMWVRKVNSRGAYIDPVYVPSMLLLHHAGSWPASAMWRKLLYSGFETCFGQST